jgi:acetoin utilization deacetylase AcuC-like enzyme
MQQIGIVQDALFREHSNGSGHPERPERLEAIDAMLEEFPEPEQLVRVSPQDVSQEALFRVHEKNYVKSVASSRGGSFHLLDPDTGVGPRSYDVALRAAGASIALTDKVLDGELPTGFAFVRPPGHHAERDHAMGFCLFNNVAVAAMHARERGVKRILILDWDVHHGNGTQHVFYANPHILYFSIHQYPLFPGTGTVHEAGRGSGEGLTVNVPYPAGLGSSAYGAAFSEVFLPIARRFEPELILVSAGFDAHEDDPLASMLLSANSFDTMTRFVESTARAVGLPGGVYLLEGGYSLTALPESVRAVLRRLVRADRLHGRPQWPRRERLSERADSVLQDVKRTQSRYWPELRG